MALQYTPYAVLLLLAAALLVVLAYGVVRYRSGPSTRPFVVFMLGVAGWVLAAAGQLTADTLAGKLLWDKLTYLGIVVVPTALLVFVLVYTDREAWVTRRTLALLSLEPLATLVVVWLNPAGWYYAEARLVTAGPLLVLNQAYGPWFWFNVVYSYLLVLWAMVLLAVAVRRERGIYRRQVASLFVGVFVPWVANMAFVGGVIPVPGLDITPFAFAVMGIAFGWALLRYRLLELLPLARRTIMTDVDAGIVVLDMDGRVTDVNPAAARLLDVDASGVLGEPVEDAFPTIAEPIEGESGRDDRETTTVEAAGGTRHVELRTATLSDDAGRTVGRVVVLQDITDRRLREERLAVLNRVLRHNLRNDMNAVLGHVDLLEPAVDDEGEERLAKLETAADELIELSEKARDVESVFRDGIPDPRPVEIVDPIAATVERLARQHPGVDLRTAFPDAARAVAVDEVAIAVRELVENAIEHADDPSPVVRVSIAVDGGVEIAVEDDGPGIPAAERDVLERGRETPLEHGSGLGLWLVNWIVETTGGDLRFEGSDLGGSRVVMRFPRAPGAADED